MKDDQKVKEKLEQLHSLIEKAAEHDELDLVVEEFILLLKLINNF